MLDADMLKVGVEVREALLTMLMVVVLWEKTNDAELSPPMLRSTTNEEAAKVLRLQKETHRLVLFTSNYIWSKLIS